MSEYDELGALLEAFVNRASHPRGRALSFLHEASVTVPQVVLLNFALTIPDSTPSKLSAIMQMSLPSVSQMIDRLVKLGLVRRGEDLQGRRRKTVAVTPKAHKLLSRLKALRSAEYSAATTALSPATRRRLSEALAIALTELADLPASEIAEAATE